MAPIWKPKGRETWTNWIDAIENEASDELSDWEIGFLDSVASRINKGIDLTQDQEKKLEQIYADKTK